MSISLLHLESNVISLTLVKAVILITIQVLGLRPVSSAEQ
jgi:hypothetical protein